MKNAGGWGLEHENIIGCAGSEVGFFCCGGVLGGKGTRDCERRVWR